VLKISSCLISPNQNETEILNNSGGILSFLITGSGGKFQVDVEVNFSDAKSKEDRWLHGLTVMSSYLIH